MKTWLEAVKSSRAYNELVALRNVGFVEVQGPTGTPAKMRVDMRYRRYLLSNEELWARTYAQ
jgi:hypothetical protein